MYNYIQMTGISQDLFGHHDSTGNVVTYHFTVVPFVSSTHHLAAVFDFHLSNSSLSVALDMKGNI